MLHRSLLAAEPLVRICSKGNSLAATILPNVTSLRVVNASNAAKEAADETHEEAGGFEDGEEQEEYRLMTEEDIAGEGVAKASASGWRGGGG